MINVLEYLNKVVDIKIKSNKEIPYIHGNFRGILRYNDKFKYYSIDHPFDIDKKYIISGESAFDINDLETIDITNINDAKTWIYDYNIFHMSVVKEKGCDPCALNEEFGNLIIK